MSSWGNKDDVASPGTVALASLTVTGTTTFFANNYSIGDTINIADAGGEAVIGAISNATVMTLQSNTNLTTGTLTGKAYTVSQKPKYIIDNDAAIVSTKVFGVSSAEQIVDVGTQQTAAENHRQIANTAAHAGWTKLGDIYTDANSNVRRKNEVLVAMSSIASDAADDTTLPDS